MEQIKQSILIVDDEDVIRDLLSEFFKRKGFEVGTAGNGKDALEIFNDKGFDVALVDFHMPLMNGLTLAHKLKTRQQETLIILMTGDTDMKTKGLADYIVYKPFNFNEFYSFLQCIPNQKCRTVQHKLNVGV